MNTKTSETNPARRRAMITSAGAIGAPVALALLANNAAARGTFTETSKVVRVGPTRLFQTIQAALNSITDASEFNRYSILIDPGFYDLAQAGGAAILKSYVALSGVEAEGTVIIAGGQSSLQAASHSRIERLTILSDGHPTNRGSIELRVPNLADFCIADVHIVHTGGGGAIVAASYIQRAQIRNCTIVTSGTGIAVRAGGILYVHDTNIHLTGNGTDHVGILARNYCRIYVFGGKIGTGYGYPAVTNTAARVAGVVFGENGSGRVVLHGVWSICRNDGAPENVPVNCLRIEGGSGWIRAFGCYFQAENPSGPKGPETIANPGFGRVELYGSRSRNYGEGPVYGSQQVGRRTYTVNDNGVALDQDMTGIGILDASAGSFRLVLPRSPVETGHFVFKKIDATSNVVIIDGNGRPIEGNPTATLSAPFESLSLRYIGGQYLILP